MANGNVCYVLGRNKFSGIFQTRKVLEVQCVADGVRKAVSKANADLAVARAEEHMMEMKTLEKRI